ncbi:helix-turn-helix transcriptional regulator [Gordonia sp. zg691]|uniref:Helix-turn-helix transcriptional regulator n=1 Tax=Gordonia jinghuaiqii TaxID=2758710 RepID=A0A7D7QVU6_9ACTN|nr:helix-turn-helix transcriptional regulator [Gordonia jinghuaiqii]MBD0860948.1 helix-turn-helix transcriptional regulator [Gordonia jinghuaiqii]MCR5979493.1 LuxR family transcriptional regulator [Gordonia jinghuaiqii]QMT00709.1 helix-turn-helix transcriptional regulator [Gordonia jinghuaiqii]
MTATSEIYRAARPAAPAAARRAAAPDAVEHNPIPRLADYRAPAEQGGAVARPSLSDREVEVLLAWLAADSKEEAAARLFISASTVSTHLARIRAKYTAVGRGAPTKTHLFARALQDGYTGLDLW